MATLVFDITADNRHFKQSLDEVERSVKTATAAIEKEGQHLESIFKRLNVAVTGFGAAFGGRALIQSIIQTRGEMQQLEVAFRTMLQSGEKANSLIADAVDFAAKTPFSLQGVASGIRQLLAYQFAAEDAIDTVEMLGNVAAGLSMPLGDLVYLYGTLKSQGRAMLVDIRQFAGRGVPIYEELSKVLGVSVQEVNGLISAGKVGFPEVEQAFKNMTSAGGMFYNLMQEQSKTITGQISNLQDAFSQMLNNIGQASEGIINKGISGVSYLIENYEKVGKTLAELVTAYGVYRTTLIAISALEKVRIAILQQSAVEMQFAAAAGHRLSEAQAMAAARAKLATAAQKGLLSAIKSAINPYALAAAGVAALGYSIYKLATYQTDAEKAQKRFNEAIDASEKASLAELRTLAKLKGELEGAKKNTTEYNVAKNALIKNYGKYYDGLDEEIEKVGLTVETYNKLTEAIQNSYGARQYEKFIKEETDLFDENLSHYLGKIQDRLIKELGDDKGSLIYTRIRQALLAKEDLDADIVDILDTIQDKGKINADARIDGWIQKIRELILIFEKTDKDARNKFGIDTQSEDPQNNGKGANSLLPKDFNTQVAEAKTAVEKAKKTLADLMAGIIPEDAGKDFDFASAIQAAEKELKAAQERYNTLTGYDPKSVSDRKKAAEDAAKELADVNERIVNEEYELQRKNSDDKLELIRMEKEQALTALQEELAAAKSVYEKIGLPTDELEAQYQKLADLTAKSYDSDTAKEIQSQFDAVLKEVETYEQARLRIQEEYAEKRKALMNEDGTLKGGVTQGNIDELARQEQEAIDAISMTFAMRDEAFEQWSASLAGKTADALELMLAEAQESLSILENTEGVNPDDMATAIAAVVKLTNALKAVRKEQAKSDDETGKSEVTWSDLNDVLQDSAAIFTELGDKIPGVAGELLSGIGTIATSAVTMANAIEGIGEAASAAEKASGILAAISAAIKVLTFVTDVINDNREANEAAAQAAWEYAEALEQIQINSRLDKYDTIFGQNDYGKFKEYKDILDGVKNNIKEIASAGTDRSAANDFYFTTGYRNRKAFKNNYNRILELGDKALVADMRSFLEETLGTGNDNVQIASLDDFFDEEGNLLGEKLRAWYEAYGEGLSDENRRIIDNLLSQWDDYTDALSSMTDYIKSLFGEMSDDVAELILTAFEKTGNAANATFDDISQQLARNFAKSQLVDFISENFLTEELSKEISRLMGEGKMEEALALQNAAFDDIQKWAETNGNRYLEGVGYGQYANSASQESDKDRTSSAKGVAQASQDSVDELNGRATVIQSHTFSIANDMKTLVNTSAMMLDQLVGIESNTAHLEMIDSNIASLNKEMGNLRSDLTMRGIKLAR